MNGTPGPHRWRLLYMEPLQAGNWPNIRRDTIVFMWSCEKCGEEQSTQWLQAELIAPIAPHLKPDPPPGPGVHPSDLPYG